jgi:hypothetical protein
MQQRCKMDGFEFDGEPTLVPVHRDRNTNRFTYENVVFCSPSCAKGWIYRDVHVHTDRINLFTLYCLQELGVTENVRVCPDTRFLQVYMKDPGTGLTIEQFRSANGTLPTGFKHIDPMVDQTVHLGHEEDEKAMEDC